MAFVRWGVDWRLTVVILHHAHSQLLSFDVTCIKKLCVISIIWIKSCIFASQHPAGTQYILIPLPLGDNTYLSLSLWERLGEGQRNDIFDLLVI